MEHHTQNHVAALERRIEARDKLIENLLGLYGDLPAEYLSLYATLDRASEPVLRRAVTEAASRLKASAEVREAVGGRHQLLRSIVAAALAERAAFDILEWPIDWPAI